MFKNKSERLKEDHKILLDSLKKSNDGEEKKELLNKINQIRSFFGLSPITTESTSLYSTAQLKDLKPLKPLKSLPPLKFPGDKDPTKPKAKCPMCDSNISSETCYCHNCKKNVNPVVGQPHPFRSPKKNERDPFYGPKDKYVMPTNVDINVKEINCASKKKKKKKPKIYESEEFSQCMNLKELKNKLKTDNKLNEVWKSCTELAIDG